MSDIVDDSNVIVDMFTEAAVKLARQDHFINRDGHCLFCDESIEPTQLFCNRDCRDDYDKEQKLKRIQGK
jgi:hypothetical protein